MNEKFLHYVWKLQYFDKKELKTSSNESVVILHPGILNTDAGPDFLNAKVKVGDITWFGNIEIHTRSSDWKLHQHADDNAYNNVILHVVYSNDLPFLLLHWSGKIVYFRNRLDQWEKFTISPADS